jgi:signal transduction histidine kinase
MKIKPFFLFLILLPPVTCSLSIGQSPKAVKGVIDLRQLENKNDFVVKLNGEWEFYWKKLLRPNDFDLQQNLEPDFFGLVPSYWTDYQTNSLKTEKNGYATYRLKVLLPENIINPLAFDLPVFDSSYDLWINGDYIGGNGIPAKTASEAKPGYKPALYTYKSHSDTLKIIINVSNYDHRRGGFWLAMRLGTIKNIQKRIDNLRALEYATISLLLGFAFFFLFFYIFYHKEKIMAFFSIALIGFAIRPLFTSQFLIYDFLTPGWQWIVRFEYLSLFVVILGVTWFVRNLYPSKLISTYSWIITVFFSTSFVLTLIVPVKVFSYSILAYYPSVFILILYALINSFWGFFKKRKIDGIYFLAFLLISYGVLNDIRMSLGKSDGASGYILSFLVVFVFVFLQAILLLYKLVEAFKEKDKLHNELEYLNRNLELRINQRTQELKIRNEEIERQNTQIALKNKQLSETIHLKNKIFSVISHDLRSPVVNIIYMLNLLKEKEYKEKYDTFANSSIEYAQLVINLLENMLVWGRGQEEKIKYSPENHELANIILTNLSIFKETADRKDITVNFTQIGSSVAYVDKDLMDIVMRNLLSNAVK